MLSLSLRICLYRQISTLKAFIAQRLPGSNSPPGLAQYSAKQRCYFQSQKQHTPTQHCANTASPNEEQKLLAEQQPCAASHFGAGMNHAIAETDRPQGSLTRGAAAQHPPPRAPCFPFAPAFSQRGAVSHAICNHSSLLKSNSCLFSDEHGMAINLCVDFLSIELGYIYLRCKIQCYHLPDTWRVPRRMVWLKSNSSTLTTHSTGNHKESVIKI